MATTTKLPLVSKTKGGFYGIVTVKLNGILKDFSPGKKQSLELDFYKGIRVEDILIELDMNGGQVGPVLVNGELANKKDELSDDSVLELYPVVGGG